MTSSQNLASLVVDQACSNGDASFFGALLGLFKSGLEAGVALAHSFEEDISDFDEKRLVRRKEEACEISSA